MNVSTCTCCHRALTTAQYVDLETVLAAWCYVDYLSYRLFNEG